MPPIIQRREADVLNSIEKLLDTTRDDRFIRLRADMEPAMRNSLLYVIRQASHALRELDGDHEPLHRVNPNEPRAAMPDKRRAKTLLQQRIVVDQAAELRDVLILTQGSEGPIDDMGELTASIDRAFAGLVEAREWITRYRR